MICDKARERASRFIVVLPWVSPRSPSTASPCLNDRGVWPTEKAPGDKRRGGRGRRGERKERSGEKKKKKGDAGDEIGPPKTGASSAPRGRRGGPGRERTGGVEASKPGLRRVRSFLCVNDPGETSDFLFFAFYGRPEKEELVTARGSDRLGVFVSTRLFCVFFIIQVLHWLPSFHAGITARILAS